MNRKISDNFKPFLKSSNLYVGGMTRDEVAEIVGDKKLYKLSSNENICGASPMAVTAAKKFLDELYEYPDRSDSALRDALAVFYDGKMNADQFITANSGSEVIENICRAFLNDGDEIIVSNPCFKPYEMFAAKLGATATDIPLKGDNYELDVDGILNGITDKTKIIFLTSPNNPTGTYIPKSTLDTFMDRVPKHILVVLDEVYNLFADAEDYVDATEYVKAGYSVLGLNSFSKIYGLAGIRLGFAYTTPEIAEYMQRLYRPFPIPTLSLHAGIAALGDEAFIKKSTDLVKTERPYIYGRLDEMGMKYWKSQANFIMIKPDMDPQELTGELLKEGIMVRPVAGFGAPDCVRVTIGDREANKAYLDALEKIMSTSAH